MRNFGSSSDRDGASWRARLQDLLSGVPGFRAMAAMDAADGGATGTSGAVGAPVTRKASERRANALRKASKTNVAAPSEKLLGDSIRASADWLINRQASDGYWVAELEADTTLESYFILFKVFMGKGNDPKIPKYAKVLRQEMLPEGGWNTYYKGPPEISISILSYFALKLAGVSADEPDMRRTRDTILKMGGATKANTYTKYHLAWFDQYDWEHVPHIPPEMIFLPALSPINIYDMSSWSRTIFVPLSILYALKPVCPLPKECHIDELFVGGRQHADLALPRTRQPFTWTNFFMLTDKALKIAEKFPIQAARKAAMKKAEQWMIQRFEKSGGLGAILPAMMNSVLALKVLGHKEDEPLLREGIRHLDELEIYEPSDDSIRIQPCHSPVWDTAISTYALAVAEPEHASPALMRSTKWLLSKEVRTPGDWQVKNPAPPGGWYFEYANEFYPDVDDTIMVMMGLRNAHPKETLPEVDLAIERAMTWVLGMQNEDGGWASFDRDNDKAFLTKVPFADHNAMIDPSTADITSRVLEMFATIAPETYTLKHPVVKRGMAFIKADQCQDGSWFGRWGVNYMYGTWQVLRGLRLIGEDMSKGYVRKAVEWFKDVQLPDGGWGERADTYEDPTRKGLGPSTASQTAWAVMGLLGAHQGDSQAVRRGVKYLLDTMAPKGTWEEDEWTGTGFPRVFYLKYHYYRHYWPLMALAQYRRHLDGKQP